MFRKLDNTFNKSNNQNEMLSAKSTVFTSKVSISFLSGYSLGKPQIRTYTQNMGIIHIKKQLSYLQRQLNLKIKLILKLTSPNRRVHTQEKLDKIKEVNLEIGDILFQIEVLNERLLDKVSGKEAAKFHEYIKTKVREYEEREERDFNIDEEGDDFYK